MWLTPFIAPDDYLSDLNQLQKQLGDEDIEMQL
jgi:hypothetical protein